MRHQDIIENEWNLARSFVVICTSLSHFDTRILSRPCGTAVSLRCILCKAFQTNIAKISKPGRIRFPGNTNFTVKCLKRENMVKRLCCSRRHIAPLCFLQEKNFQRLYEYPAKSYNEHIESRPKELFHFSPLQNLYTTSSDFEGMRSTSHCYVYTLLMKVWVIFRTKDKLIIITFAPLCLCNKIKSVNKLRFWIYSETKRAFWKKHDSSNRSVSTVLVIERKVALALNRQVCKFSYSSVRVYFLAKRNNLFSTLERRRNLEFEGTIYSRPQGKQSDG